MQGLLSLMHMQDVHLMLVPLPLHVQHGTVVVVIENINGFDKIMNVKV